MDYVKILETDSQNPAIFSSIGLIFRKLGEYKKAIDIYSQEIQLNPTNPNGYNKRAFC